MYAVAGRYAVREMYAGPEPYAERDVPRRWPRLVREAAVDGWPGMQDEAADTTADTPDPLTDPEDELFLLGERCAEAYMQADALHYHAMVLLAEFDRRSGWQDTGFSSTAEWLAWRIGIQDRRGPGTGPDGSGPGATAPDLRSHAKGRAVVHES